MPFNINFFTMNIKAINIKIPAGFTFSGKSFREARESKAIRQAQKACPHAMFYPKYDSGQKDIAAIFNGTYEGREEIDSTFIPGPSEGTLWCGMCGEIVSEDYKLWVDRRVTLYKRRPELLDKALNKFQKLQSKMP